ncbi:amino acid transporter [Boudabousia liubingyangii]|uniref:Amino acid transporter n=1 Tax=Boudabousia liubingyangii TaxID=1921764 RepID=A0A1Q5PK91_9ACTO|nr:APC family permease [Boudabousia liubingyangii]OKL46633.1 amino acid transporter [Boudabousia liubingyangii]
MKSGAKRDQISLLEAMSIGIGGMVGGGIFAVLGLAVSLAKGGTPVAFAFAGLVTLLTAYSYTKMSLKYPDRGGTVKFINQGFGRGIFSGAMNNMLWLCYIIMLSLYASAFGSYAPNLFSITGNRTADFHIYASLIIVIATVINYYSIAVVGRIESWAVAIKLVILLGFIVLGVYGLFGNPNLSQLSMEHWESPVKLFAGGMVIFVAYEGFELIANASPDIKDPQRNVPRAYYGSVIFVIALYITIAVVTVGSLPFEKIKSAQDYVLAEAARPMLGQAGFTIITIAALISTFSAINASIYGGGQVNYEVAEDQELPAYFTDKWLHQPVGVGLTALLTLLVVNVLQLESISTAGSVGFLLIFGIVNLAAFRKAKDVDANRVITLAGAVLCAVATVILVGQQWQQNFVGVMVSAGIIAFCFLVEWGYRKTAKVK